MKNNKILFFFLFILYLLFIFYSDLFASSDDKLYMADIPIFYGKSDFLIRLKKIKERKKDKKLLALYLSGGSARAFAHIGVLKKLEEENIKPDIIITNSMGSIIGLLYAAGVPVNLIENIFKSINLNNLFQPIFPFNGGIFDVSNFISIIYELIGKKDIAELDIPIIVVCEDLKSKRKVYLAKGDFYKVLKASFALPFYFEPVKISKFLLIDGGITNLIPMQGIAEYFDANIVSTTFYNKKLNLKNPITIVNVGFDIGKRREAVKNIKKYAPFIIRCDVEKFSFMDWNKIDIIIKNGYNSAKYITNRLKKYLNSKGFIFFKNEVKNKKIINNVYSKKWEEIRQKIISKYYFTKEEKGDGFSFKNINYKKYREQHYLLQQEFSSIYYFYYYKNYNIEIGGLTNLNNLNGFEFNINYNPFGYLHFKFESILYKDFSNFNIFQDNYNLANDIFYNFFFKLSFKKLINNIMIINPFISLEYSNDNIFYLLKTGFSFKVVYNDKHKKFDDFNKNYIFNKFNIFYVNYISGYENETLINLNLMNFINVYFRLNFKNSLDRDIDNIYYKINDFYRGIDYNICLNSFVITNFEINFNINNFDFTSGETFIFTKFAFTFFIDSFLMDLNNVYNVSNLIKNDFLRSVDISICNINFNLMSYTLGAGIKFKLSLIGLKPVDVYMLIGIFPENKKLFYKIILYNIY